MSVEDLVPSGIRRSSLTFPVVGLGASAGGLAALLTFFEKVPPEPGMAFVVVLHLSPQHESHAAAILQRATSMPVTQVVAEVPIEADHVYVIAPGCHLAMDDSHLLVAPREDRAGLPLEIDLFFRTLAKAHRRRALAVVLSGSGTDGTVGLADIKAEGGLAIAQSPKEAEYDGMPQAAVTAGLVDFVLPVAEIPAKLLDVWRSARTIELPGEGADAGTGNAPGASPARATRRAPRRHPPATAACSRRMRCAR